MNNKEVEELLNELKKDVKYYKNDYDYKNSIAFFNVGKIELLLSYIEQLENNRDKAIEICDFYNKKYQKNPLGNSKVLFVISNIMNILKGDSDE